MFVYSGQRRHTMCALLTGVQTCALPIYVRVEHPRNLVLAPVDPVEVTVEIDKHAFLGAVAILQHCVEAGCAYVDKIFVHQLHEIGRTSCTGRVRQYVEFQVAAGCSKKKEQKS